MIVVDASVVVTALADDGDVGRRLRDRLRSEVLVAPAILDLEVVAAWRRLARTPDLPSARAIKAIEDLQDLRTTRAPITPLLSRVWELRENLTAYDAAYVALAEVVDSPLVTLDERLASAPGPRCTIEVWT